MGGEGGCWWERERREKKGERRKEEKRERDTNLFNAIHPCCNTVKGLFIGDVIDKYDSLEVCVENVHIS